MPQGLALDVNWTDATSDRTAARIQIRIADQNACRVENRWSGTLDQDCHLSALPLALWLAASWWRLRWEPETEGRPTSWRLAHEIGAAGDGFLWPRLAFVSDGETIRAECTPSDPNSTEMLRYLSRFEKSIAAADFEFGIDTFLARVLERLSGHSDGSPLKHAWEAVLSERGDERSTAHRRIEAIMGFDPKDASGELMARALALGDDIGIDTSCEIAALCKGRAPHTELMRIIEAAQSAATPGRIDRETLSMMRSEAFDAAPRGRDLARQLRDLCNIGVAHPVTGRNLANLLGMSEATLMTTNSTQGKPPLALAVTESAGAGRFLFRGRHRQSRRFEAARLLCDGALQPRARWHPVTGCSTARQKTQRAFAAEFLAPIAGIDDYLSGDMSVDAIEGAAEYYDVSAYLVGSQLANRGRIGRDHPAVPN